MRWPPTISILGAVIAFREPAYFKVQCGQWWLHSKSHIARGESGTGASRLQQPTPESARASVRMLTRGFAVGAHASGVARNQ
jgi:hypothetical protein